MRITCPDDLTIYDDLGTAECAAAKLGLEVRVLLLSLSRMSTAVRFHSAPAQGAAGTASGRIGYLARRPVWLDAAGVFFLALALRLVFAAVTADTYDPDEFVVLALSHALAHGAVAYRDFMFFHPPGVLVFFGALHPLLAHWWPAARLVMLLVDSATTLIVWRLGTLLYNRNVALAAGVLYAASPVALLSAVRVGQDPLITALGVGGLLILLAVRPPVGAIGAGICLGLAVWIKYPAILFVPIYALAAPRRMLLTLLAGTATAALAFAPFLHHLHTFYAETVGWQLLHRTPTPPLRRVASVLLFWLVLSPLTPIAAVRYRHPRWVLAGFTLGGFFLFTSQVYYHYFVPVLPFAALLGAPLLIDLLRRSLFPTLLTAAAVLGIWGWTLNAGTSALGLSPGHFSAIAGTVHLLDRVTTPGERVLTDQFEYAYLSHRRPAADYFWNMSDEVSTGTLARRSAGAHAIVVTAGVAPTYPAGFGDFLADHRYAHVRTGAAVIWLVPGSRSSPGPEHSGDATARAG